MRHTTTMLRLAGAYAAWFAIDLARLWVEFVREPEQPAATTTGGRR